MSISEVLLVDEDPNRVIEVSAVMNFLDYKVKPTLAKDLAGALSGNPDAIVMLGDNVKFAQSAIENIFKVNKQVKPFLFITGKGTEATISKPLKKRLVPLDWPSKYQYVIKALHSLQSAKVISTDVASQREAELFRSLVGNSQAIQLVRTLIQQVCNSDATVLILGESGTGKEVIARNLHYHSDRRKKPFVPINCGAIPAELLESELFGHEKGAFTGALTARQGRFELAEGGTLFLDEIGDMPMQMQVKLLRVLQEKVFERVGSNKPVHCNVRIVAATHRNLEEAIANGGFREDLYYRLNVFPIEIAALKERAEDIPMLVHELVQRIEKDKKSSVRFTQNALIALSQYSWPGNVRELANLVERLSIILPFGVVDIKDLPEKFHQYVHEGDELPGMPVQEDLLTDGCSPAGLLPLSGLDLKEHLNNLEYSLIQQALDDANGVVAHAAKRLSMRRTTLVEKMRKYEIQRESSATGI